MDGDIHGAVQEAQGPQGGTSVQDAQAETVKAAAGGNDSAAVNGGGSRAGGATAKGDSKGVGKAASDYEAAIKERDEQIAKLQAQINLFSSSVSCSANRRMMSYMGVLLRSVFGQLRTLSGRLLFMCTTAGVMSILV